MMILNWVELQKEMGVKYHLSYDNLETLPSTDYTQHLFD